MPSEMNLIFFFFSPIVGVVSETYLFLVKSIFTGDGNLNTETASRKRRKISVKYHNEDIEECYHKVRILSNSMLTF